MKVLLVFSGILFAVQGCPPIIKHSEWTKIPSKCTDTLDPPLPYAVIHHTVGNRCFNPTDCKQQVRNIQNYHMKIRKWCDIGYSFLIGEDGNIYEGRGYNKMGAHTIRYNHISYGIAFMGNFMRVMCTVALAEEDIIILVMTGQEDSHPGAEEPENNDNDKSNNNCIRCVLCKLTFGWCDASLGGRLGRGEFWVSLYRYFPEQPCTECCQDFDSLWRLQQIPDPQLHPEGPQAAFKNCLSWRQSLQHNKDMAWVEGSLTD